MFLLAASEGLVVGTGGHQCFPDNLSIRELKEIYVSSSSLLFSAYLDNKSMPAPTNTIRLGSLAVL
jgi:hypothetical protein